MNDTIVASLNLHGVNSWPTRGKKRLADWLRSQADALEKEGDQYSSRFRATYRVNRLPSEARGKLSKGDGK